MDDVVCGLVDGPVALGASSEVTCFQPLVGTVLKIQRAKDVLTLAEVQVFSSVRCRK